MHWSVASFERPWIAHSLHPTENYRLSFLPPTAGCARTLRRSLHPRLISRHRHAIPHLADGRTVRRRAHCIPSIVEDKPHASEGNSPLTTGIRAHSWFSPSQWTRGGTSARARPSAPSTHYLLLSSPYSLLSCPFVSIRGSEFFVCFVSFVVQSIRAHSWFKSLPGLRENWENIVNPWEL